MKKIWIAIVMIAMLGGIATAYEVDCGVMSWMCGEDDINPVFAEVATDIAALGLIVQDNGQVLDEYGNRLDEHDARFEQVEMILMVYGWSISIQGMVLNQHGQRISAIEDYIAENEENWGATVINSRSGGLRFTTVENYLNSTFWDLLIENFALKSRVNELENRIDHLQAYLVLGNNASSLDVELYVGQLQAIRNGASVKTNSGYTCYGNVGCVKIN